MGSDAIDLALCEITGYRKDQAGAQTIRISFEGQTATFDVDVRSMTGIQILQAPKKLNYIQGDPLDLTGLKVLGLWEAFTSEELPVTKTDVTGYNPDNVGTQQVTVTKNEKSAFFNVEVVALTSLELDKPPTKTVYAVGEPLDLTGIIVYGNYTGSDPTKRKRELIPMNQLTNISGYDSSRIGNQQKVTITVRGQTVNFFVDIAAATPTPTPTER
jgi:hypothetical protein